MRFNIAGSRDCNDGHKNVTLACLPANYKQYFCVGLLIFEKKNFHLKKKQEISQHKKRLFNNVQYAQSCKATPASTRKF